MPGLVFYVAAVRQASQLTRPLLISCCQSLSTPAGNSRLRRRRADRLRATFRAKLGHDETVRFARPRLPLNSAIGRLPFAAARSAEVCLFPSPYPFPHLFLAVLKLGALDRYRSVGRHKKPHSLQSLCKTYGTELPDSAACSRQILNRSALSAAYNVSSDARRYRHRRGSSLRPSRRAVRMTRAGAPTINELSGKLFPSVTTLPAPTSEFFPIFAPLSMIAPMPIRELSPTVQPCRMTLWPITHSRPIVSGNPGSVCRVALSWISNARRARSIHYRHAGPRRTRRSLRLSAARDRSAPLSRRCSTPPSGGNSGACPSSL